MPKSQQGWPASNAPGPPGRRTGFFIRVPRSFVAGAFLAAPAFCSTTDFDLLRHLQQFSPPFMRLLARKQIEALFLYTLESTPGFLFQYSSLKRNANLTRPHSWRIEKRPGI